MFYALDIPTSLATCKIYYDPARLNIFANTDLQFISVFT